MWYDKGASISFRKMEQPRTNQWNISKYSCSRKSLCSPGKLLSSRGRVWRCDYTWHTTQNTQGDYLNPWHMPVDGVIESVDGEDSRRKDVNSDEVDAIWNICVRTITWVNIDQYGNRVIICLRCEFILFFQWLFVSLAVNFRILDIPTIRL